MGTKRVLLALALLFTAPSWPAVAQVKELYLAHNGGEGSLFEASANRFAAMANQRLPQDFRVVAVGNSQMGDDTIVLTKVRKGEIAFGLPSTVLSSVSAKFGIFELPFLIRNRDQVRKISDALLDPVLQPEVAQQGYRILAVWENGFRQITNNVRPIKSPADLRGLKLRVPKGEWRVKAFETLGAAPMPLAFDETYEALRTTKVDGQENPLSQIHGGKFNEVQRFLTLSDHIYTPAYLITSEAYLSGLPENVRVILAETATSMRSWIFDRAVEIEGRLLERLSETMQTNQLDVAAFRDASRPLYGEFVRKVPGGAAMIVKVAELAEVPTSEFMGK